MLTLSRDLHVKLLLHILPGPVADTMRLRLVSRAWRSTIDDSVVSYVLWRQLLVQLLRVARVAQGRAVVAVSINGLERTIPDAPADGLVTAQVAQGMQQELRRVFAQSGRCGDFFATIGIQLPLQHDQLRAIRAFEVCGCGGLEVVVVVVIVVVVVVVVVVDVVVVVVVTPCA